jgi:hypothetical protein
LSNHFGLPTLLYQIFTFALHGLYLETLVFVQRWNHRLYSGGSKTLVKIISAFDLRKPRIMITLKLNMSILSKIRRGKIQYEKNVINPAIKKIRHSGRSEAESRNP